MPTIEQEAMGWTPAEIDAPLGLALDRDPDAQGEGVGISDGEVTRPLNAPKQDQPPRESRPTEDEAGRLRQADYTRKTQELADERRALAQREQALNAMQQQLLQVQQTLHSGTPAQKAEAQRFLDTVPGLREKLDPMAASTFDALDSYYQQREMALAERIRAEVGQSLQAQVAPVQQQARAVALQAELGQLRTQYGEDIMPYLNTPQVVDAVQKGANLLQAVAFTNPAALIELGQKQAQRATQAMNQRKLQAGLEGGIPSASATPIPQYTSGESMEESLAAVMQELQLRGK